MYKLVRPFLFKTEPEKTHRPAVGALKTLQKFPVLFPIVDKLFTCKNPALSQTIQGNTYDNPIGLAAGLDRSYEIPKVLEHLEFGALELDDITPKSQPGNPQPRMFRLLEDDTLIDRVGFNNIGMNKALSHLCKSTYRVPVSINIGVNRMTPYEARYQGYIKVADAFKHDVSFFTVSISSPNTESLQNFRDKDEFLMLCQALTAFKKRHDVTVPVYLKLMSDMGFDGLKALLPAITETFGGIILASTTRQRGGLASANKVEGGSLSGRPLFECNLKLIKYAYQQINGEFSIIGTGDIFSTEDAIKMMRRGAPFIQVCSSLVIEGPGLTKKMNKDIAHYLKDHHFDNVSDIIRLDA